MRKSASLLAGVFIAASLTISPASAAAAPVDSLSIGKIGYNAYGSDTMANRNREYVEIKNTGADPVNVAGLLLQDAWARGNDKTSGCNTVKLDAGKLPVGEAGVADMLPAGASLVVYMGAGTDSVDGSVHKVYRNMPSYCGANGHVLNNTGKPYTAWDTVWVTLGGGHKSKGYNFYFGYWVP